MLSIVIAALAQAAAAPSAEAASLGERLGRLGMAASLLPAVARQQGEELVAAHPELAEADKATLRATAIEIAGKSIDRIAAAAGRAYAGTLSVADMKAILCFEETPAAARYRSALPGVIAATMRALGPIDYKVDTLAAFCARTGKLCAK